MESSKGSKRYLLVYEPLLLCYSTKWMCYGWERDASGCEMQSGLGPDLVLISPSNTPLQESNGLMVEPVLNGAVDPGSRPRLLLQSVKNSRFESLLNAPNVCSLASVVPLTG